MAMRFNGTKMNYPNQAFPTGQQSSISFFIKSNRPGNDYIFGKTFVTAYYVLYNFVTLRNAFVYQTLGDIFYDTTLTSGMTSHIAMTFNNGVYKCYVNGSLKSTQNNTSYPNIKYGADGIFMGGSLSDVEFDNIGVWQDYVLNQEDVYALRNNTSGVHEIARSKLGHYITCDGPIGSSITTASSGARSRGNINEAPTSIDAGGSATFTAPLTYTPSYFIDTLRIGPSAKTLVISMKNSNNIPTNVNTIIHNPSITINGTTTLALTGAIWANYLPYVIYPITGATIAPSDTVTFNVPSDWITSSTSFANGYTNEAVDTSYINGSLLPPIITGNKTMSLGYNLNYQIYWGNVCYSSNLMDQASQYWTSYLGGGSVWYDSNFNLTGVANGTTAHKFIARCDGSNGFDNRGYPSIMTGIYNLEWSGNGDCALSDWGQNLNFVNLISSGVLSDNNAIKYKKYRLSLNTGTSYHVDLNITSTRAPIYSPVVYHEDNRGSRWDRKVISQISGSKILRSLVWSSINNSNIVSEYDNYTTRQKSIDILRNKSISITNVTGFSNSSGYFIAGASNIYMNIQTASNHDMEDGTYCTISIPGLKVLPSSSLDIYVETQAKKISNNRFAISYPHSSNGYTVSGSQTPVGASLNYTVYKTAGYDEFMDLCDYIGAEPWIHIPHMATDELVQRIASGTRNKLPIGRKIHVEYTNEHWNFGLAFQQSYYCYGKGAENGGNLSQSQYYAKRAGQVHTLFRNVFAEQGRENDMIRTYAGQAANLNITTSVVNYAYNNGNVIDEFAIGPYWGITPDGSNLSSAYDKFNYNMLLDVAEMSVQYDAIHLDAGEEGSYTTYVSGHKPILTNRFPNAKLVCYEGGIEIAINRYSSLGQTAVDTRGRNFSVEPRIGGILNHFFQKNQDAGVEDFVYFQHAGSYVSNRYLWSVYTSPYMQPAKGDGSDGLFDNRTDINNLIKNVSPMGKTISNWQYYYNAWNYIPATPEDNDSDILNNGFYVIFQPNIGNNKDERNGVFMIGTPDEELFGTYFVQGKRKLIERPNNY